MTDSTATESVIIERTFDAPVDVVWSMWTDAQHFRSWYGPSGATIPLATMDVRVGGSRLICMEVATPNGPMRMWFAGEYVEVIPQERLVYTEAMSDENGTMSDPLGGATEVRVEFTPTGQQTAVKLTHVGIPAGSPGEAGWLMALDKLGNVIATA